MKHIIILNTVSFESTEAFSPFANFSLFIMRQMKDSFASVEFA
jgi:hypothetical protein